ncbi:MAG TPA: energy transducer TonB [Allosphingosinicella sp.]
MNRDRIASGVAAAALQALLVYGLIAGLGFYRGDKPEATLRLLPLGPEPPPPPPEPPPPAARSEAPKEAAAPPALRADASPVVAPPPLVPIKLPPPLPAAPVAGTGSQTSQGAAAIAGPGTGSGGEGTGTGGGGSGDGAGGGGTGGPPVRTRRIRGHFSDADYPSEAERAGVQGTVVARLTVGAKGRVTACRIRASSGSAALDDATCRIILKRFRFMPARDSSGAATTDTVEWEQAWSLRPEDRPEYAEAECRARAGRAGDAGARRAEFLSCMASFGWAR